MAGLADFGRLGRCNSLQLWDKDVTFQPVPGFPRLGTAIGMAMAIELCVRQPGWVGGLSYA